MGNFRSRLAPGCACPSRQENKARAEQIERGKPLTRTLQPDVRSTTTGVGRRRVVCHRVGHLRRRCAIWEDCGRFVGRSEDQTLLMKELLATFMHAGILLSSSGANAPDGRQVAQGLFGGPAVHRLALTLVRLEQGRSGPPSEHRRQLPGEVLDILHAGIHAEAASRRHLVRRVASQKDAPLAEAGGDPGGRTPRSSPEHLHRQVWHSHRRAHQRHAALGHEVLGALPGGGGIEGLEDPTMHPIDRQEYPWRIWMLDKGEIDGTTGDPAGEIGLEEDVHRVVHFTWPDHRDAEHLAHAAVRTVGPDQVLRPHLRLLALLTIEERGADAKAILDEGREFTAEAHLAQVELPGAAKQDRLQHLLRGGTAECRAYSLRQVGGQRVQGAPLEFFAHQGARPDGMARLLWWQADLAHSLLQAALPEDLHRARVHQPRLGVERRARVAFD